MFIINKLTVWDQGNFILVIMFICIVNKLTLWDQGNLRIDPLHYIQVVKGDQARNLRLETLRKFLFLVFDYLKVVVLASSQFQYQTKELNTFPGEGNTSLEEMVGITKNIRL